MLENFNSCWNVTTEKQQQQQQHLYIFTTGCHEVDRERANKTFKSADTMF